MLPTQNQFLYAQSRCTTGLHGSRQSLLEQGLNRLNSEHPSTMSNYWRQ